MDYPDSLRVIVSKAELADYWVRISLVGSGEEAGRSDVRRVLYCTAGYHFRAIIEQHLQTLTVEIDPKVPEDAAIGQEDAQPDPTPQHGPKIPQAATLAPKTIRQRLQKVKEEVHRLGESLGEQRVSLERISNDHARFSTWMVNHVTQLIEESGMRYQRFDGTMVGDTHVQFERRRVRQRTANSASASA
nr:hypothetical protein [Tanacetum cinerariifolium]